LPAPQFHLSIAVSDLAAARAFYVDLLGCREGRAGERRMDIDFFGHHLVTHLAPAEAERAVDRFRSDGAEVALRHFGVIVSPRRWRAMRERLVAAGVEFCMPPQTIRAGTVEEQQIMMLPDGCGNVVEFKSIAPQRVFAR
jgi:extradiol dioxygenase family protein